MSTLRRLGLVFALGASLGVALVALDARDAGAVGTRTFDLDTADKLGGGEQKGTAITSAGEVVAGWSTSRASLTAGTSVWSALQRADGSLLVGVGPQGRVLRVDAQGKESIVAELDGAFAATAIVEGPGGKVYVATVPNGEIFVVDPAAAVGTNPSAPKPPRPKAWAKLEADHVWALAYDKKRNELFAATGPDGKIFRVDAAGKSQLFQRVDDEQVVSLALAPSGVLYAGTSPKALLVAISAPGKSEIVDDFKGNEVKAIALGAGTQASPGKAAAAASAGDTLYCIVNEYATPPEAPKPKAPGVKQPSSASEAPKPQKGKGELVKVSGLSATGSNGKSERLYASDATPFFSLAIDPQPKPGAAVAYVGTSNEGKVVAVDDVHGSAIVAKVDERQIGAIGVAAGGGKGSWFVSGDAAAAHRVTGVGGADATWTSKPLDAGLKARFGKLVWRADGAIELETRTGATEKPDDTWSSWSAPLAAPGKVTSPAGRFVQLRARWKGQPTTLRAVTLSFLTQNLRAILTEVTVPSKGALPSGVPASGTEIPKHDATLKLAWKVDNVDNDALRYRLWYRREGTQTWRAITRDDEPLTTTEHSWNTEALAEGWYRVRVEASDDLANPIGEALTHALDSAAFSIDNTPPVVTKLALVGGKLQGEVTDGVGPIARLEVQIDGKPPWRPIAPKDGILDDAVELVDAPLGLTGSHVVALRAYDAAGNAVTREVESK